MKRSMLSRTKCLTLEMLREIPAKNAAFQNKPGSLSEIFPKAIRAVFIASLLDGGAVFVKDKFGSLAPKTAPCVFGRAAFCPPKRSNLQREHQKISFVRYKKPAAK